MLIPRDLKKWLKMRNPDCVHSSAILAYVEALEEDAGSKIAEIARLKNRINQFESAQPKWISVEERLPEQLGGMLIYAFGNVMYVTHTRNGKIITTDLDTWNMKDKYITHWMPLPEPPKEE